MRMLRSSVSVVVLASLAVASHLVACGGDDDAGGASTTGAPDASIDTGSTVTDAGPAPGPVLTISSTRAKIYLGQTAKIDGAAVAPNIASDYAWTVIAAPGESAITTASLQGASTATPSFVPDRLGSYTLQVSGKKDGVSSSVLVFIEAVDAPVFWRDLRIAQVDGSISGGLATRVGGLHGTAERVVGCARAVDPDAGTSQFEGLLLDARLGGSAGDVWEAPPGQPSRIAFPSVDVIAGPGQLKSSLMVATSQSTCGAPEVKAVDSREADGGPETVDAVMSARFSPDGSRIAYLRGGPTKARIATVGFDGSGKRDLTPFGTTPDGGLDPDAGVPLGNGGPLGMILGPLAPRWKDGTHVGFVTFVGANANTDARDTWELYEVEDKAGASAVLRMTCTLSSPTGFDFLPDGTILVATRHGDPDGGPVPTNLLVYRPNATTKACEVVRNLTSYPAGGPAARDFALSPDKTRVAFFAGDRLATVPVDGSSAPAFVPGSPVIGADPGIGPRWVAGGTAITWGQARRSQGMGLPIGLGAVAVIPAAGGAVRTLVEGHMDQGANPSEGEYRFVYGVGQGCSAAPGSAPSFVTLGGAALGIAAFVRRRRRRS